MLLGGTLAYATATNRLHELPGAVLFGSARSHTAASPWHAGVLPPGITALDAPAPYSPIIIPAPSDGATAYLCAIDTAGNNTVHIWVTHDYAHHWQQMTTLPPAILTFSTPCENLEVDMLDPQVVVITYPRGGGDINTPATPIAEYITFDGAAHWRSLPTNQVIYETATWGNVTYALNDSGLVVSMDQLRTWRTLAIPKGMQTNNGFWLDLRTGDLLLDGYLGGTIVNAPQLLWTSDDGGLTWSQPYTVPKQQRYNSQFVFALPLGDTGAWRVCGVQTEQRDGKHIVCSNNSGASWLTEPLLPATAYQAKCMPRCGDDDPPLLGIGPDGGLIAEPVSVLLDSQRTTPTPIYQLAPHGKAWQIGLIAPYSYNFYCATPTGGVIWSIGTSSIATAIYRAA